MELLKCGKDSQKNKVLYPYLSITARVSFQARITPSKGRVNH